MFSALAVIGRRSWFPPSLSRPPPPRPIFFGALVRLCAMERSGVLEFLRPGQTAGGFTVWLGLTMAGANWEPEIEQKLRACEIIILLVPSMYNY
jgi:hypothetical protein